MYQSLKKIYYQQPREHEKIYLDRFNAPFTRHFDINIKQFNYPSSHSAFLCYTEELALLIEKIYQQNAKFLSIANEISPIIFTQFELYSMLDEVKSTNDIEGIHSTRREIKEVIDEVAIEPRFEGIVKKYDALILNTQLSFNSCQDIRNFYDEFVHDEVAKDDPSNRLDGKLFRAGSVDITSGTIGKILHRGVYPESEIIRSMEIALHILDDESMPLLVRIAVFHYLFSYIHPFYDGNGRTARFISSYYIAKQLHIFIALRLSITIKRQQKKYYDLFADADSDINRGDLTPFVIGFIELISDTFNKTEQILSSKLAQFQKYRQKLKELIPHDDFELKIYDILLQSSLFYGQGVDINELMDLTGKSRNTIMDRLRKIPPDRLIVQKMKRHFYKLNIMFLTKKMGI